MTANQWGKDQGPKRSYMRTGRCAFLALSLALLQANAGCTEERCQAGSCAPGDDSSTGMADAAPGLPDGSDAAVARPVIDGGGEPDAMPVLPPPPPPPCRPTDEVCDGLDNDCDGIADNDLDRCDSCGPQHHELPVVTHWNQTTGREQYLASDQIALHQPYPSDRAYVAGSCYHAFADQRLPDFERYVGDTYSVSRVSDERAIEVLRAVCADTGVPVKLLRPDAIDDRQRGLGRLLHRPGVVQVLHAKQIDGSLATVLLPPNWSASAPSGTYPVLAIGLYDINDGMFSSEGLALARMVALSGVDGRSGAIGVFWNGGGAVGSRTMNRRAFDQFAAILRWVDTQLGGDRRRVLMHGASRGGYSAVAMASNPYRLDYRVVFIAPSVAPGRLGEHTTLQSETYPGLLHAVAWSTGLADAWRAGWTYPECAGKPHLTGLTGPEAHRYVLTGNSDADEVDRELSPISDRFIAGLKAAGTQVYLQTSTHDNIVPYAHQIEYANRLVAAGVAVHVDVLVRAGHADRSDTGQLGTTSVRINRTADALLPLISDAPPYEVPGGWSYYRVDRASQQLEPFSPTDGFQPFTLEVPYATAIGRRFPVVLVGHPETAYEIAILRESQQVWSAEGVIPGSASATHWIDVSPGTEIGPYGYRLRIRKPGAGWQEISPRNTPTGALVETTVGETEPNVGPGDIAAATAAPHLEGFAETNWGLSEY